MRVTPKMERAIKEAAARAGKSVSAWAGPILEAEATGTHYAQRVVIGVADWLDAEARQGVAIFADVLKLSARLRDGSWLKPRPARRSGHAASSDAGRYTYAPDRVCDCGCRFAEHTHESTRCMYGHHTCATFGFWPADKGPRPFNRGGTGTLVPEVPMANPKSANASGRPRRARKAGGK